MGPARTVAGLLLAGPLVSGCAALAPTAAPIAAADLADARGRPVGRATFTEVGGYVRIVVEVRGLPPGPKAAHVHAVGRCQGPDFASAGDHFNPDGRAHGMENPAGPHAGDLPNFTVEADGRGRLETASNRLTLAAGPRSLLDAGRALVIHAGPDDHRTDPAGGAGPAIACGVIRPADR